MRKLVLILSLLLVNSLLAITSEYSSDVNLLKSEFDTQMKSSVIVPSKKREVQKKIHPVYIELKKKNEVKNYIKYNKNLSIKIIKVKSLLDIANYQKSHSVKFKEAKFGGVTRTYIEKKAREVSASKVLIFIALNVRTIYYFQN